MDRIETTNTRIEELVAENKALKEQLEKDKTLKRAMELKIDVVNELLEIKESQLEEAVKLLKLISVSGQKYQHIIEVDRFLSQLEPKQNKG